MNKQEVGYKKAMLCLLLGVSNKYQSSLVSLAKVHATRQAEPRSRSPVDFSETAQLSKVSARLRSWARAGMHGAARVGGWRGKENVVQFE